MVCCRLHHCLCRSKKLTSFDLDKVIHGEKVELLTQVGWKLLELSQDPACVTNDRVQESQGQRGVLTLFKVVTEIKPEVCSKIQIIGRQGSLEKSGGTPPKKKKKDREPGLGLGKLRKCLKNENWKTWKRKI